MTKHTMVHEQMQFFFHGFRRDAHPMSVLVGSVGALSLFYHDSLDINDPHLRDGTYPRLDRSVEQVISDPKQKIGRPRQVFVGSPKRDVPAKR